MKNIFVYLVIILSLSLKIICQTNTEVEIEILSKIIECIEQGNSISKAKIDEVKKLLINYNPYNIQKVYEFMQKNERLVNSCTHDLSDVPESVKRYIIPFDKMLKKYNWKKYLECLQNHFRRSNALDKIIKLINDKKYYDASIEEINLLEKGNIPAIQCENKKIENMNYDYLNLRR